MDKFCVFCGNKPSTKSKEHIIPQWLIKLTGEPNRQIHIGPMWDSSTNSLNIKEFSFDQFQFPACDDCNESYSKFESTNKEIIVRLLDNGPLSADDFSSLLNWIDKIRIGLWLAYNYLQKNLSSVEPNYFISSRIKRSDRSIFIYKSNSSKPGINFLGTNVPAFQYLPICFTIRINQYCFFNLATDFLISKNIGLPYANSISYTDGKGSKFSFKQGTGRIIYPLIRKTFDKNATEIYQPFFSRPEIRSEFEDWYNNEYTHSISSDFSSGVGKIFQEKNSKIIEYPSIATKNWIPEYTWELPKLLDLLTKQTLAFQIHYLNYSSKYDDISAEKKQLIKLQHSYARKVNKLFSELVDEDWQSQ
jgi:hypothetical protein